MRHFKAWTAIALVVAVVIGCGPGKQLPDEIPRTTSERTTEEHKEHVPAVSDPAAKAIVDRAIAAHTQNNPSLIAKGKVSKSLAAGTMKLPVDGNTRMGNPQTIRTFLAVWPDRINVAYQHKTELAGTTSLVLRWPQLVWLGRNGKQESVGDPDGLKEIMLTDTMAQHWIPLMFPLIDSRAILFKPQKGVGTPPTDSVHVAFPDRPVYSLFFDSTTGYLSRVEYTHRDNLGRVLKEWMFADFKPFSGIMLPVKLSSARTSEKIQTRDVVEEWTVETWEFPEKLDDSAFELPKQ